MTNLKAPDGAEIQGTFEMVPGASSVNFDPSTDGGFDHTGRTEMFWDGSTTQTVAGALMFTDESGTDWMQHHLIPESAESVQADTMAAFDVEERAGRILDGLKALDVLLGRSAHISGVIVDEIGAQEAHYERLKAHSLALKERDLARVSA